VQLPGGDTGETELGLNQAMRQSKLHGFLFALSVVATVSLSALEPAADPGPPLVPSCPLFSGAALVRSLLMLCAVS
jgi:hypothetical protein